MGGPWWTAPELGTRSAGPGPTETAAEHPAERPGTLASDHMAVLSYLRLTIGPERTAVFAADLATMVGLARQQPGFHWVEIYQQQDEPHTYLILSEWESPETMRGWLRHPEHLETLRNYKRRYQGGKVDRRRYAPLPPNERPRSPLPPP